MARFHDGRLLQFILSVLAAVPRLIRFLCQHIFFHRLDDDLEANAALVNLSGMYVPDKADSEWHENPDRPVLKMKLKSPAR